MSGDLLTRLASAANRAMPYVCSLSKGSQTPIVQLDEIEVSLINDQAIAEVHLQFMSIPGATDVITFDHGEIHISVETAYRQAEEYFQEPDAEIMLYIFHGLLHLAGYEDATERGQEEMDLHQTELLNKYW